jgi:beta-glucosidase
MFDSSSHLPFIRNYENFGEDPYLASQMAIASVQGLQGNYKKDRNRVAACMKVKGIVKI